MWLRILLATGLWLLLFASNVRAISLPYEVEQTLLSSLSKKELDKVDTSNRSIVPIYRKDLDPNYIAYYEIDLHGKHFFLLSTGPKTGDYKEAQSGPPPLPTKVLRDQAKKNGQECVKYFLLNSIGIYMCENAEGRAVAATYNWIKDAPVSNWKALQKMVKMSLNDFKTLWKKTAASSKNEWKTFERKQANKKPGLLHYDAEIVTPGSRAEVALEENHGKITIHAIPESRQNQLCAILENVCKNQTNAVNQNLIRKTKNGIKYLEFQIKEGRKDVKKLLKNKEISFYVKVETNDGQQILVYFSVDLSLQRSRRWSSWTQWSIPREDLFPDYDQHRCCGCWSGCSPVAWAMVLGYYDRMAHYSPFSGYDRRCWSCSDGNNCVAPKSFKSDVKKYVEKIRKYLGTHCTTGGGATRQSRMIDIVNFYSARGIRARVYSYYSRSGWVRQKYQAAAISHIQAGYPAVVSLYARINKKGPHSAVATKAKERKHKYRSCFLLIFCSTKTSYDREFYMHMGWGGLSNGWKRISAFGAFAAKKY